jgi:hypothetical protein
MFNDLVVRLSICLAPGLDSSRFSASGLPAGQETKGAGRSSPPALLYSRSTTLESLSIPQRSGGDLSVALRAASVERLDFIIQFYLEKVGPFLLVKWAHFQ